MPKGNKPKPELYGFSSYDDVVDNGIPYTIDELFALPIGAKLLVLDMQDKDDDYSLDNRFHEVVIEKVDDDSMMFSYGYGFDKEDWMSGDDDSQSDYILIVQHAD